MNRERRAFSELRRLILLSLLLGQQTTNKLSIKTGINWRTVDAHLTFLMGKRLVTEVLKSEYVRIFALTEEGKKHALLQQGKIAAERVATKKMREEVIEA